MPERHVLQGNCRLEKGNRRRNGTGRQTTSGIIA